MIESIIFFISLALSIFYINGAITFYINTIYDRTGSNPLLKERFSPTAYTFILLVAIGLWSYLFFLLN